jgi:hypothetical protein
MIDEAKRKNATRKITTNVQNILSKNFWTVRRFWNSRQERHIHLKKYFEEIG